MTPVIDIEIPDRLQRLCAGAAILRGEGETLEAALRHMGRRHQILLQRALDDSGGLRRDIELFVNNQSVRRTGGLSTPLSPGDIVAIVSRHER